MQKLKLFGLFAALTVVLVACPPTPPVTPPAPPPTTTPPTPPTTPPAPPTIPPSTLTVQGTVESYTRGAHTLKFQVSSLAPTYAQTNIADGQLGADGKFQITLPDEAKLSNLVQTFNPGNCTGMNVTSGLQTTSGGSLNAYSSGPNSTGFLVQGTQTQSYVGNPPPGTTYTYYIYADRDARVTGTCQTAIYDMTFKKGWNLIAAVYGQNDVRVTSSVPTGLKWYYVPNGGTVNVTAPTTKLEIGKSYNFTATAQDSDGQPLTGAITWNSSDPTNMPVSADGVVTPKGFTSGVTITAYINGARGAIQNIQSYGLQIAGGTYNTGSTSLGTAFLMRYIDETGLAPTTDRSFTLTGPGGWNGGAGLSVTYPANATSAWVARDDIAPVTGNYAFTTSAPAVSGLRAQSLGITTQSVTPSHSSITSLTPIPFTPGKVVASSNAISVTGTGFAIDATQSLGQATNITIGDGYGNYTTSSVTGNWTLPTITPSFGQNTFEAQVLNTNGQVLGKQTGGFYGSGAASTTIASLSLDSASSYEWRVLSFNADIVNAYNYGVPAQFNVSRAAKTIDFKPTITGLSFGGATTAGGMELVISGRQFQNNSTIKFGSTEATSVTATQPNTINLIVPKSTTTGIVDVTVTTPAGTSSTSAATKFEYLKVTEYGLNATPILAAGPDGNVWFVETGGTNNYTSVTQVGKISSTGLITRYPITTPANSIAYITDLSAGPGNTIWLAEGGYNAKRIGKINTDGSGLTWYTLDDSNNSGAAALTAGSDGKIWFLENGGTRIGRMDTDGTHQTWFSVALGGAGTFSSIYDIKLGSDGNTWFSAPGNRVGKITTSGAINAYTSSTNNYSGSPTGLASGLNNLMWFSYSNGPNLGNVDSSGTITPVNVNGNPNSITGIGQRLASDASGNLWFGLNAGYAPGPSPVSVGRYKPSGSYAPIVVSSTGSGFGTTAISDIVFVGGRVWYARNGNTVGFVTP
jgi:hypothetical protein